MVSTSRVVVALDWTPNINHIGFYVAKAQGWYAASGLDVSLRSPHVDEYHATPASLLTSGEATFAITPSESVVSYNTWTDATKPHLQAVAAVVQTNASAVVTLKSSGLDRPAKLDGKVYASYGARYEGRIVQTMIQNDGGKGDYTEKVLPMLEIWNTLLKGEADSTWVFLGWEGVEAEMKGVDLNVFRLEDYGISYGYAPVLVAHPDTISGQGCMICTFLAATSRGYQLAASDPLKAAAIFLKAVTQEHRGHPLDTPLDEELVNRAAVYMAKYFLDKEGRWGVMEESRWAGFLDFLSSNAQPRIPKEGGSVSINSLHGGGDAAIHAADLFTNDFSLGMLSKLHCDDFYDGESPVELELVVESRQHSRQHCDEFYDDEIYNGDLPMSLGVEQTSLPIQHADDFYDGETPVKVCVSECAHSKQHCDEFYAGETQVTLRVEPCNGATPVKLVVEPRAPVKQHCDDFYDGETPVLLVVQEREHSKQHSDDFYDSGTSGILAAEIRQPSKQHCNDGETPELLVAQESEHCNDGGTPGLVAAELLQPSKQHCDDFYDGETPVALVVEERVHSRQHDDGFMS